MIRDQEVEVYKIQSQIGTKTYVFLIRVEKPEGEVTRLGGCSKLTQRLSIAR